MGPGKEQPGFLQLLCGHFCGELVAGRIGLGILEDPSLCALGSWLTGAFPAPNWDVIYKLSVIFPHCAALCSLPKLQHELAL